MKINRRTRLQSGLQHLLFVVLALAIAVTLGWLSVKHKLEFDWTDNQRNSLSEPSLKVLEKLDQPVRITAFASENAQLRTKVELLINLYRREGMSLTLDYVDPKTAPDRVRELGITADGELLIEYADRQEIIDKLSESRFSSALVRMLRARQREVFFVTGHGERDPRGQANHHYQSFAQAAAEQGFHFSKLDLIQDSRIPEHADAIVLADPRVLLLPVETAALTRYLEQGGNLLWLDNPDHPASLDMLLRELGLEPLPGTVLDADAQLYGVDDPTINVVSRYPQSNPVTSGFDVLTVFPRTQAYQPGNDSRWRAEGFLFTQERAWTELGRIENKVSYDRAEGEILGPLLIGANLTLEDADGEPQHPRQRVAVIGDADFISNQFLGNVGNLEFGLRLLNWLTEDDELLNIPARDDRDALVVMSGWDRVIIGFGFLLVLPGLLGLTGILIWRRRQRA